MKRFFKRVISVALVAAAVVGGAAFAEGQRTVMISAIPTPQNFIINKGAQAALFAGNGGEDIQKALLDMGMLSADVYQVTYKNGDVFKYGVIGDVRFGNQGLQNLGIDGSMPELGSNGQVTDTSYLAALAQVINNGGSNYQVPYTVVSPLTKQKNGTYVGTVKVITTVSGVNYPEILHIVLYDNIYFGATARVIAVSGDDDALLWPLLKGYMRVFK